MAKNLLLLKSFLSILPGNFPGKLVDMGVVIELLREAVESSHQKDPEKIILLDGFPREKEQAERFEQDVRCYDILVYISIY